MKFLESCRSDTKKEQLEDFKERNDDSFYISKSDFKTESAGEINYHYDYLTISNTADTSWKRIENMFSKMQLEDTSDEKNPAYIHNIKKHSYKYLYKKSRYPKWAPFGENLAKKCQFLYIMYVKA